MERVQSSLDSVNQNKINLGTFGKVLKMKNKFAKLKKSTVPTAEMNSNSVNPETIKNIDRTQLCRRPISQEGWLSKDDTFANLVSDKLGKEQFDNYNAMGSKNQYKSSSSNKDLRGIGNYSGQETGAKICKNKIHINLNKSSANHGSTQYGKLEREGFEGNPIDIGRQWNPKKLNHTRSNSNKLIEAIKAENTQFESVPKSEEISKFNLQQQINSLQSKLSKMAKEKEASQKSYEREIERLRAERETVERDHEVQIEQYKVLISGEGAAQSKKGLPGSTFAELGAQFQIKINDLYEDNYKLKNQISFLESQVEQERTKISSLQMTIQAFQQRDEMSDQSQKILAKELDFYRKHSQALKEQKDRVVSDLELKMLGLENQLHKIQTTSAEGSDAVFQTFFISVQNRNQELICTVKEQIDEIVRLKQQNRRIKGKGKR